MSIISDPNHRITVLEQKLLILQKEVNEVLVEMQKSMTLLMRGNAAALQGMQYQIDTLLAPKQEVPDKGLEDREGKEL